MDRKLLLVGVISNVSKTIEKELRIVLKSLSSFDDITIFLVESDSTDNTLLKLEILKNTFPFTYKPIFHLYENHCSRVYFLTLNYTLLQFF